MASSRPSPDQIRDEIRQRLGKSRLSVVDVADYLHSSRSQVQRALAEEGTNFTLELRRARQLRAFGLLIRDGRTVADTASAVGVSSDYLRVLLLPVAGIPPGHLRRAVALVARFRRWRRRLPPRFGTVWYWEERKRWAEARKELHGLLAAVPSDSPLQRWVEYALDVAKRPDHRRQPFRRELQAARQRAAHNTEESLEALLRQIGWARAAERSGAGT